MRGASAKRMWFSTRARIWRVSSLEKRKRRQMSAAMATPTSTWPSKRMRSARRKVGGLADVVEQRAPGEGERAAGLELIEKQQGVDPDVALGVELRRLVDAFHARDFRQDFGEQAGFVEQFEGAAGMAFGEHLGELVAHALAADGVVLGARARIAAAVAGSSLKPKRAAKRTARSMRRWSSSKRSSRAADGADDAGFEVGDAADVVDESRFADGPWKVSFGSSESRPGKLWLSFGTILRIEQEAVDGEVAAPDVFFGADGVADGVGMAAVGVGAVGAEGGDLVTCGEACDWRLPSASLSADRRRGRRRSGRLRRRCAERGRGRCRAWRWWLRRSRVGSRPRSRSRTQPPAR